MSLTLTVRDATTSGDRRDAFALEIPSETTSARELIRGRVYQEVKDFNLAGKNRTFSGLVQPTESECELNGYRLKTGRQLDWTSQFNVALDAFKRNGFLILVDDRQIESLDDPITLTSQSAVTFLKLVPLVGG